MSLPGLYAGANDLCSNLTAYAASHPTHWATSPSPDLTVRVSECSQHSVSCSEAQVFVASSLPLPFSSSASNDFWDKTYMLSQYVMQFSFINELLPMEKWLHSSLWEERTARYTGIKWPHWVAYQVLKHKYLEKRFTCWGVVVEDFDVTNSFKAIL